MTSWQTAGTCVPGADVSMVRLKVTKLTLSAKGCKGQETVTTRGGTSAINFHHIISYHIISYHIVWYRLVLYRIISIIYIYIIYTYI